MAKGIDIKQKLFCEYYSANGGNAKQAAIDAGYSHSYASKLVLNLLNNVNVREYLKELNKDLEEKNIASIEEIQLYWTNVFRGKVDDGDYPAKLSDRNKASELLMKSKGGFLDKVALVDTDGKSLPTINLNFIKAEKEE